MNEICVVIETLGAKYRNEFLSWFVELQLSDYNKSFHPGLDVSQIDYVEARFSWLEKELTYLETNYASILPSSWNIAIKVAEEFCITTKVALSSLLSAPRKVINVVVLVKAIQKTIEYEKILAIKFNSIPVPVPVPIEEESYSEEEVDEIEEVKDFTPEAIRNKWSKFMEHKAEKAEKRKEAWLAQRHIVKFKGLISSGFGPYLELYIDQEDSNMSELLAKLVAEETWILPDDEQIKVLQSSTHLIYYFNEARKRCTSLTRGQPLFDLYMLFKKYLSKYRAVLTKKVATFSLPNKRVLSDIEEKTVCLIVNTADYCRNTIAQITEVISEGIDQSLKEDIEQLDLNTESSEYSNIVAHSLETLKCGLELKLEPCMKIIRKAKWNLDDYEGDQSDYITQLEDILKTTIPLCQKVLSPFHYSFLCDSFGVSFFALVVTTLYKCSRISDEGAHRLLMDIQAMKMTLLAVTGCNTARFVHMIDRESSKAKAMLKVILAPLDTLVTTYCALIKDGDAEDFQKILKMKGIKGAEKRNQLNKYLYPTPPTPPTPPAIPLQIATTTPITATSPPAPPPVPTPVPTPVSKPVPISTQTISTHVATTRRVINSINFLNTLKLPSK